MSIYDEAKAQAELERRARQNRREPFAQRMIEATDDAFLRDIVRDNRRSVHERSGIIPPQPSGPERAPIGRNGWVYPPAIADWRPPGLAVMDRMLDQQTRLIAPSAVRDFGDCRSMVGANEKDCDRQ